MSSIDGELVLVLLTSEGAFVDQQPVMLRSAIAIFAELSPGSYTVIARHPSLSPTEAVQNVQLQPNRMIGVKFVYSEAERQLLRIEIQEETLDV